MNKTWYFPAPRLMPFLLYIAALMKKKKRKSPSKRKGFPEVTASRIKPEKQEEGLHLVRKKRLLGKKPKETL